VIIGRAYKKEKKVEIKIRRTNERFQIEEKSTFNFLKELLDKNNI